MAVLVNGLNGGYKLLHNGELLSKAYHNGVDVIWSANTSNKVIYHLLDGSTRQEIAQYGDNCLIPKNFDIEEYPDWYFKGWREDISASGDVLTEKIMIGDEVNLYAVYACDITLTYDGNGATSGSTKSQTGTCYRNGNNITKPTFKLDTNGFIRTDHAFKGWAMYSPDGAQFNAGEFVSLDSDTTFYAVWSTTPWIFLDYTRYPLTKTGEAYATNVTVSSTASGYKVGVRDTDTGGGYATVTASTSAISTKGCNKVRVKYRATYFDGATVNCGTINGVGVKVTTGDYLYLDCVDTFVLTLTAQDSGTATYTSTIEVTELYFYSE